VFDLEIVDCAVLLKENVPVALTERERVAEPVAEPRGERLRVEERESDDDFEKDSVFSCDLERVLLGEDDKDMVTSELPDKLCIELPDADNVAAGESEREEVDVTLFDRDFEVDFVNENVDDLERDELDVKENDP
jgi:hypothetical protein